MHLQRTPVPEPQQRKRELCSSEYVGRSSFFPPFCFGFLSISCPRFLYTDSDLASIVKLVNGQYRIGLFATSKRIKLGGFEYNIDTGFTGYIKANEEIMFDYGDVFFNGA